MRADFAIGLMVLAIVGLILFRVGWLASKLREIWRSRGQYGRRRR